MPQVRPNEPQDLDSLARGLGVPFDDAALLLLAFTHSSYANEDPHAGGASNERLEFLGDAVVGLAVAERAYKELPEHSEGGLTSLRAALVQDETLARVARSLGLGRFMLMGRGEDASGGRERMSNLAALFEALAGAVYLDQGFEAARGFVIRSLSAEMDAARRSRAAEERQVAVAGGASGARSRAAHLPHSRHRGRGPRAHVHRRGGGVGRGAGAGARGAQVGRGAGGGAAGAGAAAVGIGAIIGLCR